MTAFPWVAVAAVLGLVSTPELPMVDLGVENLEAAPSLVSRRTADDWWALQRGPYRYDDSAPKEPAVRVLRSRDQGRTWQPAPDLETALGRALGSEDSLQEIDFLEWYSPEVGLAAGYIGARVLRTTDAGRTWRAVPLPEDLWVYTLERVGTRVWACGSSGRIFRSEDAGESWKALPGSPFDGEDRCMSLSFLTVKSGWAAGMRATLWATEDGGESWRKLDAPKQAHRSLMDDSEEEEGPYTRPPELREVLRLTSQLAWVQGSSGAFQTLDGGKIWRRHSVAPDGEEAPLRVSRRPDGRRVVTGTPPGLSLEQWVPYLEEAWVLEESTVARPHPTGLRLDVAGEQVRAGPLLTRGSGQLVRLEGVAQRDAQHWLGWVGDQIAATKDGGRRWYRLGRVPRTPLRDIVFLRNGMSFAELPGGYLLRTVDGGRSWEPSTDALEAYDFAVAAGRRPGGKQVQGAPPTPFDCVLSSPGASVKVQFDVRGCFGGTENTLRLRLGTHGAELSGVRGGLDDSQDVKRSLTREEGRALMQALVAATTRPEVPSLCQSTTAYAAIVEWTCPSGVLEKAKVEFLSHGCDPGLFGGLAAEDEVREMYERALGIHEVAARALEGSGP